MRKKQIDHISNIMSKRHDFLLKTLSLFFSSAGKTGNFLINCKIPSFGGELTRHPNLKTGAPLAQCWCLMLKQR